MADRKAKIKINFWAFRWGALKGTPTARLRRALGKAEPVFEALRLRLGLQILPASLTLRQAPSVLANATSNSPHPSAPSPLVERGRRFAAGVRRLRGRATAGRPYKGNFYAIFSLCFLP